MGKANIWFIIALSLVAIGCIVFVCVMTALKWDFAKFSTDKYQENKYEISQDFNSISIDSDTADIKFVVSNDSKRSVVCYEQTKVKYNVEVDNDTLKISVNDTRKWYEYIGFNFQSPKITVYLPESEYISLTIKESTGSVEIPKEFKFSSIDVLVSTGDVKCFASATENIKITSSTGGIYIQDLSCGSLDLKVSTGKINVLDVTSLGDVKVVVSTGKVILTNVSCKNLVSSGNTGDISLQNVVASEKFDIERSTGDVKFEGCDAGEIFIQTDTGDVDGSLLTEKVFIVKTDTGSIDVPNSITGGRCEITTDTGDVKIMIKN